MRVSAALHGTHAKYGLRLLARTLGVCQAPCGVGFVVVALAAWFLVYPIMSTCVLKHHARNLCGVCV